MNADFEYEGRKYRIVAGVAACYDSASPCYLKLPDGRILVVGGWLEVMPPIPTDITNANFLRGIEPDGAFVCEEVV